MNQGQTILNQYKRASLLAQITIFYNLIQGMVSVLLGASDETQIVNERYPWIKAKWMSITNTGR